MSVGFESKLIADRRNARIMELLERSEENVKRTIRQGFFQIGRDLQAEANREILKGNKTGRVYFIRTSSGGKRRHVSSAPGESHANLTGALRKSLGWSVTGFKSLEFGYGVDKPTPQHAEWLEFGTVKMKARPTLRNAIAATERNAEVYFGTIWRDVMEFERRVSR